MPPPRLLDRVREATRLRHLSPRTEKAYVGWVRRFVVFNGKRHPSELGEAEITAFLSWLATERNVSASTQNQALASLLFLYRVVLGQDVQWLDELVRARRPMRLPVVLAREEVAAVVGELHGVMRLMVVVLYGAGLRLLECAGLRVKDVDFERRQLLIRGAKGDRDRATVLPTVAVPWLARQLDAVRRLHERDPRPGAGWVELPSAIGRKCPNAGRDLLWQWVFPARRTCSHRETGQQRRHHLSRVRRAARCGMPPAGPRSASESPVTPSGTRSRRISSRTATTAGPSRRCSDIATYARP